VSSSHAAIDALRVPLLVQKLGKLELLAGVVLALAGAEVFVNASVGLARMARLLLLTGCHAKSVAWTIRVIFPGIYNVCNGFTVIWLFNQFRWSSCNKLALFSDLSDNYLLGALLESSLSSRVEREEMLKRTIMGGLLAGHGRLA
jgi:hypothetical protein